ncbi:hypothetical protein HL653_20715 [Sphingomonas sp. AP4-R1]|uniref:hypothetical protein n=1 Tax=Sphingomonas sp. AP4-R1 TaxID=2735134 RepID=UPI0014938B84|nr:hypothetical protein [Sphingomonas sp. AP4-R1]QJU60858.1 hypothetical protein HL653_20715 [Sphingomonas sp. AP4-R1]
MILILRLLAGIVLMIPTWSNARPPKPAPAGPVGIEAPADKAKAQISPSAEAARVIAWVLASKDNHGLPWLVVDKKRAALFLFDAKGGSLDAVPVLLGLAEGDDASPGVGSKKLADLGPAEKTTPAGRFLAKFGLPVAGERVLWVDYATSVALHPIPKDVGARERRRERMLSLTADDNRITFGCINVPKLFYGKLLRPLFQKKGGYVYVLPDTKPIEVVFPRLRVQAVTAGATGE